MPLIMNENTGLTEKETPALLHTCWNKSKMTMVAIAMYPDEVWLMPTEEATAYVYSQLDGEMKNAKVVPGSMPAGCAQRTLRFTMRGAKGLSLKDKKFYLDINSSNGKNRTMLSKWKSNELNGLSITDRIRCAAMSAMEPSIFSNNEHFDIN